MKYKLIFLICLITFESTAQKYKAIESKVHFFSSAPIEDIEATNTESTSILDLSTGNIVFSVPVKQFLFEKSLMQEHFNENYLESEKYPKIVFVGKMSTTIFQEGNNPITVKGKLDLHGVKQKIEVKGIMQYKEGSLTANAGFFIRLVDYKIKIPKAVFYNIAEEIAIAVDFTYEPY